MEKWQIIGIIAIIIILIVLIVLCIVYRNSPVVSAINCGQHKNSLTCQNDSNCKWNIISCSRK